MLFCYLFSHSSNFNFVKYYKYLWSSGMCFTISVGVEKKAVPSTWDTSMMIFALIGCAIIQMDESVFVITHLSLDVSWVKYKRQLLVLPQERTRTIAFKHYETLRICLVFFFSQWYVSEDALCRPKPLHWWRYVDLADFAFVLVICDSFGFGFLWVSSGIWW